MRCLRWSALHTNARDLVSHPRCRPEPGMMFPAPCHRAQTPAAMGTCRVRAQRLALSRPRRFTDDGGRLPHASPRPTTQTQDPWPQSAAPQRPRECAFPPYSSTHVPGWETEGQRRTAPPSRSREEELGTHLSLCSFSPPARIIHPKAHGPSGTGPAPLDGAPLCSKARAVSQAVGL